jgi:hypothetical protein
LLFAQFPVLAFLVYNGERAPTGEYVVDLKVSARGYEDISIRNIFIVNK